MHLSRSLPHPFAIANHQPKGNLTIMNLNQLRDELHSLAKEKGWYDQPETDDWNYAWPSASYYVEAQHASLTQTFTPVNSPVSIIYATPTY